MTTKDWGEAGGSELWLWGRAPQASLQGLTRCGSAARHPTHPNATPYLWEAFSENFNLNNVAGHSLPFENWLFWAETWPPAVKWSVWPPACSGAILTTVPRQNYPTASHLSLYLSQQQSRRCPVKRCMASCLSEMRTTVSASNGPGARGQRRFQHGKTNSVPPSPNCAVSGSWRYIHLSWHSRLISLSKCQSTEDK